MDNPIKNHIPKKEYVTELEKLIVLNKAGGVKNFKENIKRICENMKFPMTNKTYAFNEIYEIQIAFYNYMLLPEL
jgi:hypothetical protein